MIQKFVKGRTAVFIDAANLEKSVKDLGWKVHYRHLRSYFNNYCNLLNIRFYSVSFDTENHKSFLKSLEARGYKVITKPIKIIKNNNSIYGDREYRKANFDVEIAVDAISLINDFDTFILFSGDSDFDYLLTKLRERGRYTIVISTKYHISKELIKSADKYIDFKKLKKWIIKGL